MRSSWNALCFGAVMPGYVPRHECACGAGAYISPWKSTIFRCSTLSLPLFWIPKTGPDGVVVMIDGMGGSSCILPCNYLSSLAADLPPTLQVSLQTLKGLLYFVIHCTWSFQAGGGAWLDTVILSMFAAQGDVKAHTEAAGGHTALYGSNQPHTDRRPVCRLWLASFQAF